MPERYITVYSCSNCSKDIDDPANVTSFEVSYASGERSKFDLCPTCWNKHEAFFSKGEPIAKKNPPITRREAPKPIAGQKLFKCPDCSFTHHRPQSLAVHRARMHGYRSPRRAS